MSEEKDKNVTRRKALKILSATAGATTVAMLPAWNKPQVGIGSLPAFAQASPPLGTGDLQVTLTWDTGVPVNSAGNKVDIDLHVIEPDNSHVYYNNKIGTTATLDFDNVYGFGPENIYVPTGNTANGFYRIYIVYYSSDASPATPTNCTIRVKAMSTVQIFTKLLTVENPSVGYDICTVQFPAGTITPLSATRATIGTPK
jgi:uncharacterized protein YfaP (DUF2135 family)